MDRMKLIGKFCIVLLTLTFCLRADAQSRESDVFIPIGKYIMQGNADALSAWFDDNLEIKLLSQGGDVSKSQARQIVKSFFEAQTPQGFKITHTSGRNNMKYALGALNAGGETYSVTIFVTSKGGTYKIREFRIERQ
jgi:hypothetical protein